MFFKILSLGLSFEELQLQAVFIRWVWIWANKIETDRESMKSTKSVPAVRLRRHTSDCICTLCDIGRELGRSDWLRRLSSICPLTWYALSFVVWNADRSSWWCELALLGSLLTSFDDWKWRAEKLQNNRVEGLRRLCGIELIEATLTVDKITSSLSLVEYCINRPGLQHATNEVSCGTFLLKRTGLSSKLCRKGERCLCLVGSRWAAVMCFWILRYSEQNHEPYCATTQ